MDGLKPLLYTDYSYPASNKAYINAGYEDKGILINLNVFNFLKILSTFLIFYKKMVEVKISLKML